ncbi:FAD-dependent oxidoreductase [Blastococcus brunescens]|uniref:FAD-dependent oxidoreductase n=1 Tax=Blastococcus brunescens TaxID=1564165 RepID=A0ABZ1AUU9_9ACTN|nr:FAD-dependent oxidoreductase [Blastococcus sp. BMG 8361]WRL62355.1 FAD-dependent oxidoreductase [Blastococcus sp. BMG 8361]
MTTSRASAPAVDATPGARPRVVIIGSGFGGLFAAQRLRKADVDVTLIGKTSHHLFQPLLYQVATGILSEGRSRRPPARSSAGRRTPAWCSARSPTSTWPPAP